MNGHPGAIGAAPPERDPRRDGYDPPPGRIENFQRECCATGVVI